MVVVLDLILDNNKTCDADNIIGDILIITWNMAHSAHVSSLGWRPKIVDKAPQLPKGQKDSGFAAESF